MDGSVNLLLLSFRSEAEESAVYIAIRFSLGAVQKMTFQPDDLQSQILRDFTVIDCLCPDWGGAVVLSLGLDARASALPFASSIAGAVSLVIDNEHAHVQQAIRAGACDFVVDTLDEALRAMKNEVRKHTPVSVCLDADPVHSLDEILERGLVPQLFTSFLSKSVNITKAIDCFRAFGATLVDFRGASPSPSGFQSSRFLLDATLQETDWRLHSVAFDSHESLRTFDARALTLLQPEDTLRHRWLENAPRTLHRLHRQCPWQRSLWLTRSEQIEIDR